MGNDALNSETKRTLTDAECEALANSFVNDLFGSLDALGHEAFEKYLEENELPDFMRDELRETYAVPEIVGRLTMIRTAAKTRVATAGVAISVLRCAKTAHAAHRIAEQVATELVRKVKVGTLGERKRRLAKLTQSWGETVKKPIRRPAALKPERIAAAKRSGREAAAQGIAYANGWTDVPLDEIELRIADLGTGDKRAYETLQVFFAIFDLVADLDRLSLMRALCAASALGLVRRARDRQDADAGYAHFLKILASAFEDEAQREAGRRAEEILRDW